jgi:hypothetical protein
MFDLSGNSRSNYCNPIATRTWLIYLFLGFEVRLYVQRLPKIQREAVRLYRVKAGRLTQAKKFPRFE